MGLEQEYALLQEKIAEISNKIFARRDEIIEMYDSDHLTTILPHRKRRKSLAVKDMSDKAYSEDALKCCFYQTFMMAREKQNSTNVVVIFPSNDDRVYGAEIKRDKKDRFTIEKINLPYYVSPKKLFKETQQLGLDELRKNINLIQKSIIATENRHLQMHSLKVFPSKIGLISVSPCTQVVNLKTLIENKDYEETNMFIIFIYTPMSFRPTKIEVQFEKEIFNDRYKSKIINQLNVFTQNELLDAYKIYFKL